MRVSLRNRLLLPPALLLAGTAAATWWAARHAAASAERQIADRIRSIERTVAGPPTFRLTAAVLGQMRGLTDAEFVFVGPAGERVTTFPEPTEPRASDDPLTVAGRAFRSVRLDVRPPHPEEGGRLYVYYPEDRRRQAITEAVRPPLALGIGGGLVAFGLALVVSRRLVNRVRDIEQHTRAVAGGRFEPMELPTADDELRDLCRSVNEMAARLAEYRDALRRDERLRVLGQVSGGLAHQLRNAAAGATLGIQIYLSENPAADAEPLQVALRQLARVEANVRQFLALGQPPPPPKPLDLSAVLADAIDLHRPRAAHAGIALVADPPTPAPFAGDPSALGNLFANLIGNALDAVGTGGEVRVSGPALAADHYVIEVRDTGPGPPPGVAAKLFEPFVTGRDQGIGLGLAVAKQAADAHGGTLTWHRDGDATVFRVELPAADNEDEVGR